uniref:Uncharacterized protein n=1 Tax=Fervidicoccus fontis TaxID=683846 RepID=A0A7J3ZL02_9CREN
MGEPSLEELKSFIAEKIRNLRRELSLYESILAILEENSSKRVRKTLGRERGEIVEVRAGDKSIGILVRDQEILDVKLFFDINAAEFKLDLLKKKIEALNEGARVHVERTSNGTVKSITIKNVGTGIIAEGITEIVKEHLLEEYKKYTAR